MFNVSCNTINMLNISVFGCGLTAVRWGNVPFYNMHYPMVYSDFISMSTMAGYSRHFQVYDGPGGETNDIQCNLTLSSSAIHDIVTSLTCNTYVGSWNLLLNNYILANGYWKFNPHFPSFPYDFIQYYSFFYLFNLQSSTAQTQISNCITGKWCMYLDNK